MLGKPRDAAHARELLARLAGRRHEVVGGIAIAEHGVITAQAVVVTAVDFRALDAATLDWYVATGEWEGRAGGYAIQGRAPPSSRGSRATTSTSSACRSRGCSSCGPTCCATPRG